MEGTHGALSSDAYLLCWEEGRRDPETAALGNALIWGTCDRDSSTSSGPEDGGRVLSLGSGLHGTVLSTDDKSVHSQLPPGQSNAPAIASPKPGAPGPNPV